MLSEYFLDALNFQKILTDKKTVNFDPCCRETSNYLVVFVKITQWIQFR